MEKDSAGTRQGTGGLEAGWRHPAPSLPVGRFQSPSPPHAETGGGLCTWKPASFSHADTAGSWFAEKPLRVGLGRSWASHMACSVD